MTTTEFGYCPKCDEDHVELTMTTAGMLACHRCGNIDVYDSREAFDRLDEYMMDADTGVTGS